MKYLILAFACLTLTGCATNKEQMYYETAKAISKDNTMSQTACWSAIAEIVKGGDNAARVGAIALAERCKNETVKIESPKRNWLGL
jgi:uncharacterized lipoprotein YajG